MKKIAAISLIAILSLTGCASSEMDEIEPAATTQPTETASPEPTEEETTNEVETPGEEVNPPALGEYIAGFGADDYNAADTENLLSNLAASCDTALLAGSVESYGTSRSVIFSDSDSYEGYSAIYYDGTNEELLYSLDYFFSCFIYQEYSLFLESGETNLDDFPTSAVEVADGVFQVAYGVGEEAFTSQYVFTDGLLSSVVSDPSDEPFTLTITYGTVDNADKAKLKELVDGQ